MLFVVYVFGVSGDCCCVCALDALDASDAGDKKTLFGCRVLRMPWFAQHWVLRIPRRHCLFFGGCFGCLIGTFKSENNMGKVLCGSWNEPTTYIHGRQRWASQGKNASSAAPKAQTGPPAWLPMVYFFVVVPLLMIRLCGCTVFGVMGLTNQQEPLLPVQTRRKP